MRKTEFDLGADSPRAFHLILVFKTSVLTCTIFQPARRTHIDHTGPCNTQMTKTCSKIPTALLAAAL